MFYLWRRESKNYFIVIMKRKVLKNRGRERLSFTVPAGRHEIVVRLRDGKQRDTFDYEKRATVELAPMQNLAIDFKADAGGFIFR